MFKLSRLAAHRGASTVAVCVAALAVSSISPAWAQQVEPMVFSLTPTGSGASRTVRMDNPRSAPITVEVEANAVSHDDQGVETWTPADDDFQIFPPQSLIQPGQSQAFRVRYIGDPALQTSRTYRISLKQLPIELPENESGIVVGLNFNTLVNIVPPSTRSDLVVNSVTPDPDGAWRLWLENRGTRYVRLTRTIWTVSGDGRQETIPGPTLFGDIEHNLVPPGARREVVIASPPSFDPATVAITVSAPPTE